MTNERSRLAYETPVWWWGGPDESFTLADICKLADPSGFLGGITAHTVAERLIAAMESSDSQHSIHRQEKP